MQLQQALLTPLHKGQYQFKKQDYNGANDQVKGR